jgi:hypothetical protein
MTARNMRCAGMSLPDAPTNGTIKNDSGVGLFDLSVFAHAKMIGPHADNPWIGAIAPCDRHRKRRSATALRRSRWQAARKGLGWWLSICGTMKQGRAPKAACPQP